MEDKFKNINAILNKDLENLLIKTGQINDFLEGNIKCMYCNEIINYDNLSIILPSITGDITTLYFCCNNPECLSKFRMKYDATRH